MTGTDLPLMEEVVRTARLPVIASGGVSSVEEMRALKARGVAGVVLGMALYTGVLDAQAVAEEFSG